MNFPVRCFLSFCLMVFLVFISVNIHAQPGADDIKWAGDGKSFYQEKDGSILQHFLPDNREVVFVAKEQLVPSGQSTPLGIKSFAFSADGRQLLLFTNTKRVWRYETRGDYWVMDLQSKALKQVGKQRPPSSLLFAKFSPDGSSVAYTSEHNIYTEDLATGSARCLTSTNGTLKLINGTFDWVYEEELDCRDGFRWSPDGKHIAYWQIDANQIKDYLMLNTTDSLYSFVVPVEYPLAGELPSPYKIGVVDLGTGDTKWMSIPGDPQQTYLPRMEWAHNSEELILQQLNRRQNGSTLLVSDIATGNTQPIYEEHDSAFIECRGAWQEGVMAGWDWLNGGKEFLWVSEKDGWRHIYRMSRDGKKESLLTRGDFDIITVKLIDEKNNWVYFMASPDNATQQYLFRARLDGKGKAERLSPADQAGVHDYDISPGGLYAQHDFSSANTEPEEEWISLPKHTPLGSDSKIAAKILDAKANKRVEFFKVTTVDGVTMDGWMVKPVHFDSTKKYPVLFYVYGEPAAQTVVDRYGTGYNFLYPNLSADGYIYMSLDNRGSPAPKGRGWRKIIYRQIGRLNIRDQAMAAKEILKWPFVDSSRIAVWGWSGGGSSTLNLLFQYPGIYKTGIAIAAESDLARYDNIYQERYMGLPQENRADYVQGSPVTYAKNLKGNLLFVHGTGDDNVHYQHAELLLNELIKDNKVFQFMAYPNRTHGIHEGEGTRRHLSTIYTAFLRAHCEPGGR